MHVGEVRQIFEKHDLRWTKQREDVYSALCVCRSHPTADELFHMVNGGGGGAAGSGAEGGESGGAISLATVYNCLDAFMRCGLCRRLTSPASAAQGDGAFRYDAEMHDHAHVVTSDGRVRDLPEDLNERVISKLPREVVGEIEKVLGVKIDRISVEFIEAVN